MQLRADGTIRLQRWGQLQFRAGGRTNTLSLYWKIAYGGGLFLPFCDSTNRHSDHTATYGGGRYLLDTIKQADLGTTATGQKLL